MQADRAHWIYIAEAAHRMGCDSQKICVCVCVCVAERHLTGEYSQFVLSSYLSVTPLWSKLMQRYTTPYSRVLLHMIKSLPLSLSLNYLFLFFPPSHLLLLLLLSLRLLCFSHIDSVYPFYSLLSPTLSLSKPSHCLPPPLWVIVISL